MPIGIILIAAKISMSASKEWMFSLASARSTKEKFVSEIERISKKNSHIIINLQLNNPGDDYSENLINDPKSVEKMFKNSELIISRKIKNTFDEMNYEFVLQKN